MITDETWSTEIHPELLEVKKHVYDSCNFACTDPIAEAESKEYGAHRFLVNAKLVVYRVAKLTPTKTGQFVTLWKRNSQGITAPFDQTDNIDFVVICTRSKNQVGQFVFPTSTLIEKGIMSTDTKEGKRAIRVYPPWNKDLNKQAEKTQQWQLDYFLDVSGELDSERAKQLYGFLS